ISSSITSRCAGRCWLDSSRACENEVSTGSGSDRVTASIEIWRSCNPTATTDGSDMKIATWNVNSILARLPHVTRWLEAEQPDVLCVQETKCTDDKFPSLELKAAGYDCVMLGQQSYNGVAIISKAGCASVQRGYPDDDPSSQARLLSADIAGVRIVNVYIPNGQMVGSEKYQFKLQWMNRLREFLDANYDRNTPVLLCGDFNVAPETRDVHDPRLWQNRILFSEPEKAALQHIKDWGFTDAFRQHTEEGGH